LMLGVAVLGLLRARVDLLGLSTWILFAAFSLHSARNIPLFGVLAVPWMAVWLMALFEQEAGDWRPLTRLIEKAGRITRAESLLPGWPIVGVGVALISLLALQPDRRERYRFSAEVFPVAAVEALLESGFEPPGPIYNEFGWGGYLLYRAWPGIPVFIDGQTDFYGEELTKEYTRIRALAPDWKALLDKHDVQWALIPPDVALNQGLEETADWDLVHSDSTAVVWVRQKQ
jgi:hypothetical protein